MRRVLAVLGVAAAGVVLAAPTALAAPSDAPPVVHVPADITVEATSAFDTHVPYAVTATDDVGVKKLRCDHPASQPFFVTTTTVTCTATDTAGQTASASFTVTVRDTTPPTITTPGTVTATATSKAGAVVGYAVPVARDAVDGQSAASCDRQPGQVFAIGTTTVHCLAVDGSGNRSTTSFVVDVVEKAPSFSVPADVTAEATGPTGAVVTYRTPAGTDQFGKPATVTCTPPSGSTFALGTTTVTCTATAGGSTTTKHFRVLVEDTAPPLLSVPSRTVVAATSASGAVVTYVVSADDVVSGPAAVTCAPASGSTFPIGRTVVTCSATDGSGHTAGAKFSVVVKATKATKAGKHAKVDGDVTTSGQALPDTGADTDDLAYAAYFAIGLGALLVRGVKRRPRKR